MTDKPTRNTRAEILAVARELFARHGYQRTALREIAERLGVTKAAVLYHFPGKPDILAALAEPLLDDLDAALGRAAASGPTASDPPPSGSSPSGTTASGPAPSRAAPSRAALGGAALGGAAPSSMAPSGAGGIRWAAIEGMLDALLAHRQSLRMVLHDLALLSQNPVFHRFSAAITTANRLVAGPDPDLAGRVAAAQAIAMLGDPVILLADTPTEPLRREILAGVRRLLTEPEPGPQPAPVRRRGAGRPTVLDADRLALARELHATGTRTVADIAAELGVSRATLYRHLNAE